MKQRTPTATMRARVNAAERDIRAAEARLEQARKDLEDAKAAELVATFRAVDWMVLEDIDCGGILVRYVGSGDYAPPMPRRFVDKPGCLVSGCSDARIPVSNRTMALLRRSGLAVWHEPLNGAHEMRITQLGQRHLERRRADSQRKAA